MKKIDAHIHMHTCDMERGKAFFDHLAKKGVTGVGIQVLSTYWHYSDFENIYSLWIKKLYDKMNVYVFGSIHELEDFGKVPYEDQLKWLLEAGCDGIKFINMKPNVRKKFAKGLNHPSYDKLFDIIEEKQIPILIHSKDPSTFWHEELMLPHQIERGWCYAGKGFETYEDLHRETLELLDKHPKLNAILAHFFFLSDDMAEAERIMEKYPNVYFDITPGTEMYENFAKDTDSWREFFIKYQDRIIFGTDADDGSYLENADDLYRMIDGVLVNSGDAYEDHCYIDMVVKGLSLPEEVVEKIYHGNFEKYMGKIAPVNTDALKKAALYAYEVLKDIPQSERDAELFKSFAENI